VRYPLLGTTLSLVFTAADLASSMPNVAEQESEHEPETRLVKDLLARFSTRREQVAEWSRETGKCRRTFERRLANCGSQRPDDASVEA
jgi:hypothetical protein